MRLYDQADLFLSLRPSDERERVRDAVRWNQRALEVPEALAWGLMLDPVMGIEVIMGIKFDVFQRCIIRHMWWVPRGILSSGYGTGKSFCAWAFLNYRGLMIPEQRLLALYQTFDAGKDIFWQNYDRFRHPLFETQLGRVSYGDEGEDGRLSDNVRGAACWSRYFRNGSILRMPAPNWLQEAKSQAGKTFHAAIVDEWTKIETMAKKESTVMAGGIDQQIIGRLRGANWNQHHPIWDNHIWFLATAEATNHPAYKRVQAYQREIRKGNTRYCLLSFSFKDFSMLPGPDGRPFRESVMNYNTIKDLRNSLTAAHFLREGLGIWSREGRGWFSEDALERCVAKGIEMGIVPEMEARN